MTAGQRKVRIVAPSGQFCDQEIALPASKTTIVDCPLDKGGAGSGSAASATGSGSGSAGSGSATVPPPEATLEIQLPSGARGELSVDGVKVGPVTHGQKLPVAAGKHKLQIVAPTGTCEHELELVAGKTAALECKKLKRPVDKMPPEDKPPGDKTVQPPLDKPRPIDKPRPVDKLPPEDNPADKAAALENGYLNVYSKPPAKISIDGKDTGLATPITGKALSLAPGKHKVTFTIGGDRFTFAVTIKSGATETLSKDLQ